MAAATTVAAAMTARAGARLTAAAIAAVIVAVTVAATAAADMKVEAATRTTNPAPVLFFFISRRRHQHRWRLFLRTTPAGEPQGVDPAKTKKPRPERPWFF
jgi:hypothetical protein